MGMYLDIVEPHSSNNFTVLVSVYSTLTMTFLLLKQQLQTDNKTIQIRKKFHQCLITILGEVIKCILCTASG